MPNKYNVSLELRFSVSKAHTYRCIARIDAFDPLYIGCDREAGWKQSETLTFSILKKF